MGHPEEDPDPIPLSYCGVSKGTPQGAGWGASIMEAQHSPPLRAQGRGPLSNPAVSQAPRLRPSGASMVSVGPGPGPTCSFGI